MSADFIEPNRITNPSDWEDLVADLDQWGEVPDPATISNISSEWTSRGLVLQISAELEWIAEFLPWGSDGLLRTDQEMPRRTLTHQLGASSGMEGTW